MYSKAESSRRKSISSKIKVTEKTPTDLVESKKISNDKGSYKVIDFPEYELPSLDLKQMLTSQSFWLYLIITVFGQGITYMSNITSIIISLNPDATASSVSQVAALHITLMSIGQSIGRYLQLTF
jgi:hypothetical protein